MSGEDDGESSNSEFVELNENGDILDNEEFSRQLEERKRLRSLKLGFEPQKEIVYNKQLPYSGTLMSYLNEIIPKTERLFVEKVDQESTKWFADIKANLGRAIALRELRPGIVTWISRLNKYIRIYGLKFPKADHVTLIKMLMSFVTSPGKSVLRQERCIVIFICQVWSLL